jgi:predicted kinase
MAYEYGMFTRAGNRAVGEGVETIVDAVRKGATVEQARARVIALVARLKGRFPEVTDTAVREVIAGDVNEALARQHRAITWDDEKPWLSVFDF